MEEIGQHIVQIPGAIGYIEHRVDAVLNVAGYTYGPLLGLFSFGVLTTRHVRDKLVPVVCVISPALSYILSLNSSNWFGGYIIGIEILIVNGLITFAGLWVVSRKAAVQ